MKYVSIRIPDAGPFGETFVEERKNTFDMVNFFSWFISITLAMSRLGFQQSGVARIFHEFNLYYSTGYGYALEFSPTAYTGSASNKP